MIKDFIKIGFSNIVCILLSTIEWLVVPKFLGPEMFGVRNMISLIATFSGFFSGLALDVNYSRRVPYSREITRHEEDSGFYPAVYISYTMVE